jgi:beta-phosphoglucomutase-like phosphatase (HAD superfamily)
MPDLSTIKAVLFDVDGTLTNSDPLHFKAFQDILQEYNYKVRTCLLPHDMQSSRHR